MSSILNPVEHLSQTLPIIAILRGVTPENALTVGQTIFAAGIRSIEIPLNSPQPFASIRRLSDALGAQCLCGAGTVTDVADVQRVHDAGGRLVVAPNADPEVIRAALALGMLPMPGIATVTEAFAAFKAGATHLKLFPAATYGSRHLKALLEVLPKSCRLFPVGGIGAADMREWRQAGAAGFGFGSELFRPSYTLADIATRAAAVTSAFQQP